MARSTGADESKWWRRSQGKTRGAADAPKGRQGGEPPGKPGRFDAHLTDREVEEGRKQGTILIGNLHVNKLKRLEGYVRIDGLETDIIVKGVKAQNRALHGDVVAVHLLPTEQWEEVNRPGKERSTVEAVTGSLDSIDLGTSNSASNSSEGSAGDTQNSREGGETWTTETIQRFILERGKRPVGKVVGIIEKTGQRERIVCYPTEMAREGLVLRPVDSRFPWMWQHKPKKSDPLKLNELLLVKCTGWSRFSFRPFGEVVEVIGKADQRESQISASLFQHGIQTTHLHDFSDEVMGSLPREDSWQATLEEELEKRRDVRDWRIFSIDPETARDLDDALSIQVTGSNSVRIGVHIADVSHFVRANTPLDSEAASRATSVYMTDKVLPMLPRLLCEELCSLNPGTDRLAFSIVWDMDMETCEIKEQWIGRTVIRSCAKLNYGQAQDVIEGRHITSPCKVDDRFRLEDIESDVKLLDKLAKNLRQARFENGSLTLNNPKLYIQLDENQNPIGAQKYEQKDSNYLVEEFMLLANKSVAEFLTSGIQSAAVLRRHPQPQPRKLDGFRELAAKKGFKMDTSSSGSLHKSLLQAKMEADEHIYYVLIKMATKPMQNALYFCTGGSGYEDSPEKWRHYALAFDNYTHFTSPIRRYPDILVHRLVTDLLMKRAKAKDAKGRAAVDKKSQVFASTGTRRSPWGGKFTSEIAAHCEHCNKQKLAAKNVQEDSAEIFLALFLQRNSYEADAVVLDLNGPKWMEVLLIEFGIEVRVWFGEDNSIKTKWNAQSKKMEVFPAPPPEERKVRKGTEPIAVLSNFDKIRVSIYTVFNESTMKADIHGRVIF